MSFTLPRFEFVRKALNCNQDELATMLGVSRTHLAHAENHRRTLPDTADLRLLQLYQLLLQQPVPKIAEVAPTTEDLEILRYQWQRSLDIQQKKVDDMRKRLTAALQCLQSCEAIRANQPVDEKLDISLRLLYKKAQFTIFKITPERIAIQTLKLQVLQAGMKELFDT